MKLVNQCVGQFHIYKDANGKEIMETLEGTYTVLYYESFIAFIKRDV